MLLKSVLPFVRPKRTERWALRDVDFEVTRGETVGLIGRNGAGKTTLLRLLAGVTRPSEGSVSISGRVAPLISVGVGFHQEMSGRENIFVNGMLLGLNKRQAAQKFDEIVAFAELEDYIDTPVKFYSSGMFMRLGFSVAAHVDPDILLVDEVLAVGDLAFQVKCLDRMRELQNQGVTIFMVSHAVQVIRGLCPRAIFIRNGRVEFDGDVQEAIARHHELMTSDPSQASDSRVASIVKRQLMGAEGPTYHPDRDQLVTYRAEIRFHRLVESPHIQFQVVSQAGTIAYDLQSALGKTRRCYASGDVATVEVPFKVRLAGGTYRISLSVMDRNARTLYAHDTPGLPMFVGSRPGSGGVADLAASIRIDGVDSTDFSDFSVTSNGSPAAENADAIEGA